MRLASLLIPLVFSLLLGACSSVRLVDTEVRSFAPTTLPAPTTTARQTYQIERLPSQQTAPFDAIEEAVKQALTPHGLTAVAGGAALRLQIEYTERQQDHAPWEAPRSPFWGSFWLGSGGSGVGLGMHFPPVTRPWFERELHLILRRDSDRAVVFETRARHDGIWADTTSVLPAMLEAALRDYPQGHPEVQTIHIDIPR